MRRAFMSPIGADDPWYGGYVRIGARGPYRELMGKAFGALATTLEQFLSLEV